MGFSFNKIIKQVSHPDKLLKSVDSSIFGGNVQKVVNTKTVAWALPTQSLYTSPQRQALKSTPYPAAVGAAGAYFGASQIVQNIGGQVTNQLAPTASGPPGQPGSAGSSGDAGASGGYYDSGAGQYSTAKASVQNYVLIAAAVGLAGLLIWRLRGH